MAPGSGVFYGVFRKAGRFLEYSDLTPVCGALQRWPAYFLTDRGNNMKRKDLNKSMCEELIGKEFKITVKPDYSQRSDAGRQRDCLYGTLQSSMERLSRIKAIVGEMDTSCRTKKTCS